VGGSTPTTSRTFEVADVSIHELANYTLVVNGRERRLDWTATLSWLSTWATDLTPQWSAITQGDPTDVNLAAPFALFDYDTAGRNALCGEFANFCWYTGFLGGFIVPRANPAAFAVSPRTFDQIPLNTPAILTLTKDETARRLTIDLIWRPAPARLSANRLFRSWSSRTRSSSASSPPAATPAAAFQRATCEPWAHCEIRPLGTRPRTNAEA
jgi:hypothetical protein